MCSRGAVAAAPKCRRKQPGKGGGMRVSGVWNRTGCRQGPRHLPVRPLHEAAEMTSTWPARCEGGDSSPHSKPGEACGAK